MAQPGLLLISGRACPGDQGPVEADQHHAGEDHAPLHHGPGLEAPGVIGEGAEGGAQVTPGAVRDDPEAGDHSPGLLLIREPRPQGRPHHQHQAADIREGGAQPLHPQ